MNFKNVEIKNYKLRKLKLENFINFNKVLDEYLKNIFNKNIDIMIGECQGTLKDKCIIMLDIKLKNSSSLIQGNINDQMTFEEVENWIKKDILELFEKGE